MKNSLLYFSIIMLSIFSFESTFGQWQECNNGLNAGEVNCLVPTNSGVFAVVTGGGLYFSSDDGKSWVKKNKGLDTTDVNGLMVWQDKIYAATASGIFTSTNNGNDWELSVSNLSNVKVNSLNRKDNILFAGTFSGLYSSYDHGSTWDHVTLSLIDFEVKKVIVGSSYIVACSNTLAYLSSDNGNSWKKIFNGYGSTSQAINSVLIVDTMIYIGTNLYLFELSVNDTSLTILNNGLNGLTCNDLLLADGIIFTTVFGYNSGVYKSTNMGKEWTRSSEGLLESEENIGSGFHCLAYRNEILYVGTYKGGVYCSSDKGNLWCESSNGIRNGDVSDVIKKGNDLFASCLGKGIFKSANNGDSWELIDSFNGIINLECIAGSGNNLILSYMNLFFSSNDGKDWEKSDNTPSGNMVQCFLNTDDGLLAGGFGTVLKSTDDGKTWTSISNGITQNSYIYCLEHCNGVYFAGGNGLFRSTDKGANWNNEKGWFKNEKVISLSASGDKIYASVERSGIFVSSDTGENWIHISSGLPTQDTRSLIATNDFILTSVSKEGLFITYDGGQNWVGANKGLPASKMQNIKYNIIGNYIYGGFYNYGLYRIKLSELASLGVDEKEKSGSFGFFPNPATEYLNINIDSQQFGQPLTIFNSLGEELHLPLTIEETASVSYRLDVSQLPTGVYFVKAGNRTGKFVKM